MTTPDNPWPPIPLNSPNGGAFAPIVGAFPAVSLLLDHIATVTGSPKSQIVNQALFDALPLLLDRVDALAKRSQALSQSIAQAQKGGKR